METIGYSRIWQAVIERALFDLRLRDVSKRQRESAERFFFHPDSHLKEAAEFAGQDAERLRCLAKREAGKPGIGNRQRRQK